MYIIFIKFISVMIYNINTTQLLSLSGVLHRVGLVLLPDLNSLGYMNYLAGLLLVMIAHVILLLYIIIMIIVII